MSDSITLREAPIIKSTPEERRKYEIFRGCIHLFASWSVKDRPVSELVDLAESFMVEIERREK